MRAGRIAVIATATLSAVLFAAPSALAATKTSDAVGGDVTCTLTGKGWEQSKITCKIRDTKNDDHTTAVQYRLHYSWNPGNPSGTETVTNTKGDNSTRTWKTEYAEGVSFEFRAVVLRTFNSYGQWKYLDGERG
ncbi:hypothetical protein NLX83_19585 [Allokutzneria sp. A3M-2-11 16]|uniref:hypothetical protein n=1 Tax=Allokutzneria sp. A3M-2-11 16 TaxID=2962043 RepID=UPI0020B7BAE0|nr:hypothetical protein [Allokutzneria sp. A3M-2-11 16]MCP3801464.1 hypothetical protein [Allokutzneria sp. A3M-2-11 16]